MAHKATSSTIEEMARKIFGERAESYTVSAPHTDKEVLGRIVELARPRSNWIALDIATGAGHAAFAIAPHVASVIATDLTPEMLEQAERLKSERGIGNTEFREADVHALPFDDNEFDLVICRLAAHHFSDIKLALREMRRVLKPGGRLVINDRSVPEDDFVDQCMNELDWYHDESHVRQYRPSEWRTMMTDTGFAVETAELYTKHRPLTSLTAAVGEENVRKLHARLEGLNEEQRQALNLTEVDGEPHINHWYVLISAENPEASEHP